MPLARAAPEPDEHEWETNSWKCILYTLTVHYGGRIAELINQ
jgi:hypothetical protein